MSSSLVLICGLASAAAFGAVGGQLKTCGQCICTNDRGDQYDKSLPKKCCPTKEGFLTDSWNGFCDATAIHVCEDECMVDGELILKSEPHQEFIKEEGDVCKTDTDCADHHVCYQGPNFGVCSHIMNAAHHIVLGLEDIKHLEHTADGDGVFHVEKELTPEEIEDILQHLAERLGVPRSELSLDKHEDAVLRRQYGQPQWNQYQFNHGQQYQHPYAYSNGHIHGQGSQAYNGIESSSHQSTGDPKEYAKKLSEAGIQLLAFDWDKTANNQNTYQESFSGINQVAGLISHTFIDLATEWCKQGKHVAIVTYNDAFSYIGSVPMRGPDFIKAAVDLVLPAECASLVKIYARNDHSQPGAGKSWHLTSAQQAFGGIGNAATMLLDDTTQNDQIAAQGGYKTTIVAPKTGVTWANIDNSLNQLG